MQQINRITRGLALTGLLSLVPLTSFGDTLTLVDESGQEGDKTGCTYQALNVGSSGATTIRLSNFTCLGTASTGSCSLDGVTIQDGGSQNFYVNTPMPEADCALPASSGSRTCSSGSLGGVTQFVKSQCVIAGLGSCQDADSNIINHAVTDTFYTSANESCSSTTSISRTCTDGVLSPSSGTHLTTNCNNTPTGQGVVDTGSFRDNTTIGPMTDPDTGYQVYIMDRGNFATGAPSCVNGLNPNLDCGFGGYGLGAKTTDVNAIRAKTSSDYSNASIKAFPLPYGGTQVTSAWYDYVVASEPGKMTSDFTGACALSKTTTGTVSLVTQSNYDSQTYLQPYRCVVPRDTLFYINIRARSSACDVAGAKCNSYITPAGLL